MAADLTPSRGETRAKPEPLFHALARELAHQIDDRHFAPGSRLPAERWLSETRGVSRTTVRRALRELIASGKAEQRGNAIHVAHDTAPQSAILGFTQLAASRGLTPSARVLLAKVRPASFDEADLFAVAAGADLFELERLRMLDGAPIGIDHDRVPLALLPQARQIDFRSASFFASLSEAGHTPVLANLQIEARNATKREVELLKLPRAVPVLVLSERATDRNGKLVTLGVGVYRSDRHRFLATFVRTPPAKAAPR